jgi:hypothetical protein
MERAKNKPVEIFRGKLPDLFLSHIHISIEFLKEISLFQKTYLLSSLVLHAGSFNTNIICIYQIIFPQIFAQRNQSNMKRKFRTQHIFVTIDLYYAYMSRKQR